MANMLYIIGNGFDRYHGLETSYQLFAFFLQKRYPEIYHLLIEYYNLPDLNINDKNSYSDPLWRDFESELASLDFETILEDNTDYLANPASDEFRDRDWHAYQFEMEGIVDNLTNNLCKAFKEFILQVNFSESVDEKLILLERDSIFLSFNYTDTLEKFYGIAASRILYIHGKAKNEKDKLILGHGVEPSEFEDQEEREPENLSEEELEQWRDYMANKYEYSYSAGKQELMCYFSASYKSTSEVIQDNINYFDAFSEVNKIFVLGHSLSEIDQPYFKKIIESLKNKNLTWTVTYHSISDVQSHLNNLKSMGIKEKNIELVKMQDLRPQQPTLF